MAVPLTVAVRRDPERSGVVAHGNDVVGLPGGEPGDALALRADELDKVGAKLSGRRVVAEVLHKHPQPMIVKGVRAGGPKWT